MASHRYVSEDLHREVKVRAIRRGMTVAEAYQQALEAWLAATPAKRKDREASYGELLKARLGWQGSNKALVH